MANFVCVKCGRQCEHYASPSLIKAQMCSVCFNEEKLANEQKEPFKSGNEADIPDDVRTVEPKSVRNIDELLNDLSKKRSIRNECNGVNSKEPKPVSDIDMFIEGQNRLRSLRGETNNIYSRSELFPKARHCAICEHELDDGICLKASTGAIICESCHYKLYYEKTAKPLQSEIEERYDCIPQEALRAIARVMGNGTRKYGPRNWDKISYEDHVNHALRHINLALLCDTEDEPGTKAHISHAMCRLFFAYETYKEVSE